jgi:hypothetical protein
MLPPMGAPGGGKPMFGGEPACPGGGKGKGMLGGAPPIGGPAAMFGGKGGGAPPGKGGIPGIPFGGKGGMPFGGNGGMLGALEGQRSSPSVAYMDLRPPRPMKGGGIPGIPGIPAFCQHFLLQHPAHRLTSRHRHWRSSRETTGHGPSRVASAQIRCIQRIRLAFRAVRIRDAVDDLLCLLRGDLFVVRLHVAQVVAAAVVRLAHAHTVVRKVHIAVIAEKLRHCGDGADGRGCLGVP